MKRKSGLLWFVLLLSMSSCVSYEKFSIEVLKPAKFSLPLDIQKIAIVSRNLKYENDTLQYYQVKNRQLIKDKIRYNSDSMAVTTCIDSLADKLLAQKQFDSILILPVNSFPVSRVKEIRPGREEWYKNISNKTGVDGLIMLDMFSCFYSYSKSDEYTSPKANVITSNIWTVYNAHEQKIIDRFAQVDTLYWDGTNEDGRYKRLQIPAKKEAIVLAAGVIGENYSKHISHSWTMVYRDIMGCSKPDMREAAKLAQKGKWEDASAIWQKYADSKNKRNKIIALYNLALANEMNGNIDQALELTSQAALASSGVFWSSENEVVRKYSAVLYRRKIEIKKLDAQHDLP